MNKVQESLIETLLLVFKILRLVEEKAPCRLNPGEIIVRSINISVAEGFFQSSDMWTYLKRIR
jgi:hypothetical protein